MISLLIEDIICSWNIYKQKLNKKDGCQDQSGHILYSFLYSLQAIET